MATQLKNSPSGAWATEFSDPLQAVFASRIPASGGERKYRGSYLRGDPQNTNLPHDVVPKT